MSLEVYLLILDMLRQRKTPHPINQDFNEAQWRKFFSSFDREAAGVSTLEEFGVHLNSDMAEIRGILNESKGDIAPDRHRGHECLAHANSFVHVVEKNYSFARDTEGPLLPDFMAAEELDGVEMNLRPTFVSFVEAVHDGLRLPLHYFKDDARTDSGRRIYKLNKDVTFGARINNLASLYNSYEFVWGSLVWRNALVEEVESVYTIKPINQRQADGISIARHINEAAFVQSPMLLFPKWFSLPVAERLPMIPPRADVSIRKGVLKAHWRWGDRSTDFPPLDLIAMQLTEDRIPRSIIDLVSPVPGISTSDVLAVRSLLREIGSGLVREISGAHIETKISLVSAVFEKNDLCKTIQEVLKWPLGKIESCVDLFIFKDARSEVWFQPLVSFGSNKIGVALHPLCHASPTRTLEWLFSCDKKKEGEKGAAFEDAMATYFSAAGGDNEVVDVVVKKRLRTNNEVGDIDLLIVFDDTWLIIECKCIVHPSSDNDIFNRERSIKKASMQADRKVAFVASNLSNAIKRYALQDCPRPKTLVPLVLVTGNEFVGTCVYGDVYVASKASLAGVIANFAPTLAKFESGGSGEHVVPTAALYSSKDEARRVLLETIAAPQLIDIYRPYLTHYFADYHSVVGQCIRYKVQYGDVTFDKESKVRYLKDIGFDEVSDASD